jgi:hypothetical protein
LDVAAAKSDIEVSRERESAQRNDQKRESVDAVSQSGEFFGRAAIPMQRPRAAPVDIDIEASFIGQPGCRFTHRQAPRVLPVALMKTSSSAHMLGSVNTRMGTSQGRRMGSGIDFIV